MDTSAIKIQPLMPASNEKIQMTSISAPVSIAVFLAFFIMGNVQAEYPERPVSFVVPWPPGDLEDVLTRIIAEEFQLAYGVPTAVVNKPGGGGGPFPGAIEVANAPADGYTIGSFITAIPVVGPRLGIADLNPDPFVPLGNFLTYPFVLAAGGDAPYSNVAELTDYAKTHDVVLGHFGDPLIPTQVTFGLAKVLGFEFAASAAFDALDCNTLDSGDADVINTTLQQILPCLDRVKVLVSIGSERIPMTPDTPTVQELVSGLGISLWNGLFVHKDTPEDVQEKIIRVAKSAVMSERAQKLALRTGAQVYWQDADSVKEQIVADIETMSGIKAMLLR